VNTQNYIHLLKHYREHEIAIQTLLESLISSLEIASLLRDHQAQMRAIQSLSRSYPFIELMYSLDAHGVQLMDSVYSSTVTYRKNRRAGRGSDRRHRPYVHAAQTVYNQAVITSPYLSHASQQLTLSGVYHLYHSENDLGYLVLNFNLKRLIAYLKGDMTRAKFHPWFKAIYAGIGGMLIFVALLLLYSAGQSFIGMLSHDGNIVTDSFGIVIIITLAMSIFDLGKTVLEEEVLLNKDIHHHDTTRRTISRFITAIIIAVSIEALLLMFKSLLNGSAAISQLNHAVWMLLAAVAMMTGLGAYLYLSKESKQKISQ
jgi:hypothetical protein